MKYKAIYVFTLFAILLSSCQDKTKEDDRKGEEYTREDSVQKNAFLPGNKADVSYSLPQFSGQAEVVTYELSRARYNNVHPGEAVLIFVTEPFLPNSQVKSDMGSTSESIKVLKMNKIDRFSTGVYDYSMYTSVFTPIEKYNPRFPLKVSFSSQDWCGQLFTQVNNSDGYMYSQYSYFQKEADTVMNRNYALLEENIFNLARIDTSLLPVGEFELFPAQSYLRTAHIEFKKYDAIASIGLQDELIIYNYEIPQLRRSVRLFLDPKDDMKIVKWTETYPTVFDGELRTSIYTLKSSLSKPYWSLNQLKDNYLRDSLDLIRFD